MTFVDITLTGLSVEIWDTANIWFDVSLETGWHAETLQ